MDVDNGHVWVEIPGDLDKEWPSFKEVLIKAFMDYKIFKVKYPDKEERRKFIGPYMESKYEDSIKDGKGAFALVKRELGDKIDVIGGISISYGHGKIFMKENMDIDPEEKFNELVKKFGTAAWTFDLQAVHPEYQHQSIGHYFMISGGHILLEHGYFRLLKQGIKLENPPFVFATTTNERARRFIAMLGMLEVGESKVDITDDCSCYRHFFMYTPGGDTKILEAAKKTLNLNLISKKTIK